MTAKKGSGDDWFEALDEELEKATNKLNDTSSQKTTKKFDINKELMEDLWRIYLRFDKINAHLGLDPEESTFMQVKGDEWSLREDFDYALLNRMALSDRTEGRVGDGLQVHHYLMSDGKEGLKITFNFMEGEKYDKYKGWMRLYSHFNLYDVPLSKADMETIHGIFSEVVKKWYESYLKRDREYLLSSLAKSYEKGETQAL